MIDVSIGTYSGKIWDCEIKVYENIIHPIKKCLKLHRLDINNFYINKNIRTRVGNLEKFVNS